MATEVVRTIRAAGGDYSTYSGWVAGEARDLVSLDEIAVAEIYNDWPAGLSESSPSDISNTNFITDADHPVILRAAAGHRHNGTMMDGSGNYTGANLVISGSGSYTWNAYFMVVDGLILRHLQSSTSARHLMNTSIGTGGAKPDNLIIFRDCIGGNLSTNSASSVFRATNRRDIALINCLAYEGQVHFTFGSNVASNTWVLNCTSIGAGNYGFISGDNNAPAELINCLATGSGTADFNIRGGNKSVTYCAASDSSLPVGTGNRNSQTFVFRDAANDDYRLDPTDTGALGYGQDLSAHSVFPFSADILGVARGTTWDIGAFQVTTSGGGPDIAGSLSATLDNATLSSTGELLISGSLSATLADATSSASGAAPITGALSAILDDATLTATGAGEVEGFGSLSVTLDGVSLSATGALDIVGQVSVTLANVSLAASGELLIQGEASPALDDVTLSAAGELITGESGRLNVVLDDVTLSAVGVLSAEGSANIQLDAATLVAQGQLLIQGAASIALDDVTLSTDPGSAPLPNRYYGVIPGGGMVVDVLENGTTTGRAIELRVNDSVYGDRLAVIVGVKGIIDYLNTKETRPIA